MVTWQPGRLCQWGELGIITLVVASIYVFTLTGLYLALRLRIRTLEAALRARPPLGVVQAVPDIEHERDQARADEFQRILLTIQAMREATDFDPAAEHVLNRVEAAVTRLSTASSPGRPTLPERVPDGRVPEDANLPPAAPSPLDPAGAPVVPMEMEMEMGTVLPVPLPGPGLHTVLGSGRPLRRSRGRHARHPFASKG